MNEPIRIAPEELADPRVDAALESQRSFGLQVRGGEERPTPLYLRPWFALACAGLLAGLFAWLIIEPFSDDGLRLHSRLAAIDPIVPGDEPIAAMVTIAGARLFVPDEALILDERGDPIAVGDLHPGDPVEVLASFARSPDGAVLGAASLIRREAASAASDRPVDFEALETRDALAHLALFPILSAIIGMFLGATDGLLSRAWGRAALTAAICLGVGAVSGMFAALAGGTLYGAGQGLVWGLSDEGSSHGVGLLAQIIVRGMAWAVVGLGIGLGQGIALRSKKLAVNGLIGGTLGGLFGGLLFDPLNLLLENVLRTGGAEVSRLAGYCITGAGIGLLIGIVEMVARDAWLKLLTGPIAGKEFILYRDPTWIGSSPKCEVYLFKDAAVAPRHARIRRLGEHYEIEDQGAPAGTLVGARRVTTRRLEDRDRIRIGDTAMEFRLRDD